MDFDLTTSIEESASLMEVVNEQNKILEAILVADKLEKQYRMQGYSEAQIQQFHEGWMDKVKGAAGKLNPFKKKETTVSDKVKNAAVGAWEWIKKMIAKFVNFCKRVWLHITTFLNSDKKLLEKYKDELSFLGRATSTVKIKMPKIVTDSTIRPFVLPRGSSGAESYRKAAKELESAQIVNTEYELSYGQLVKYLNTLEKMKDSQKGLQDAIKSVKEKEAASNPEHAKAYISYLNAKLKNSIKLCKAGHSALRKAIIQGIAKRRGIASNESAQILEQQLVDVQYMYESLIMESDEVDKVIDDSIDVKSSDVNLSDVNLAGTDFGNLSDDPNKLVYDKDCYSQDIEMGDENIAGTVDIDPFDTTDKPISGNQTKAMESALNELLDFDLTY